MLGHRPMLHTAWHHDKLSLANFHGTIIARFIPIIHPERTAHDEKHLVFPIVVMPYELALKLHELYVLPV